MQKDIEVNQMKNTKIEWCDDTWNPVTGCLHGCEYCYARGIAHRFEGFEPRCGGEDIPDEKKKYGKNSIWNTTHGELLHEFSGQPLKRIRSQTFQKAPYPYGFDPTFHRYRLKELTQKTKPRTIFVGSMTDLFGKWVPSKWIADIMEACLTAPQHRYLFLTKNPERFLELAGEGILPQRDNFWYGTTATRGNSPIFWSDRYNTFMSVEPILEPFLYPPDPLALKAGWVILGAETGNRKDKVVPERSWIEQMVRFLKDANIPVFMKGSLIPIWGDDIITEFPW